MSGIIEPDDMVFVPKRWGYEIWICNNEKYCGKKLFIRQGKFCSFHHHSIKDEVLYLESGCMTMTYEKDDGKVVTIEMLAGQAFHVSPGTKHQMQAIDGDVMIVEFSTQHFDEDSYQTTVELVLGDEDVDYGDSFFHD